MHFLHRLDPSEVQVPVDLFQSGRQGVTMTSRQHDYASAISSTTSGLDKMAYV